MDPVFTLDLDALAVDTFAVASSPETVSGIDVTGCVPDCGQNTYP